MKNGHRVVYVLLATIAAFIFVRILIGITGWFSDREFWALSIVVSLGFLIFLWACDAAIKPYIQSLGLRTALKIITFFYCLLGGFKLITPSHIEVFDEDSGEMEQAYCPVCESERRNPWHDIDDSYCGIDGEKLIKTQDEFAKIRSPYTTSEPIRRLVNGGRILNVDPKGFGWQIIYHGQAGERITIKAFGEVNGSLYQNDPAYREVSMRGWDDEPEFLKGKQKLVLEEPFMALVAKIEGEDRGFFVGEEKTFYLRREADVFLGFNDIAVNADFQTCESCWTDNFGNPTIRMWVN